MNFATIAGFILGISVIIFGIIDPKDLVGGGGNAGETTAGALAGSAGSLVGMGIGAIPSLVSKLGIQGGMLGAGIGAIAAGSPIQKGAEAALGALEMVNVIDAVEKL